MAYTTDEFAEKIKAKYPQYANINNAELTNKIISKYPEYKTQVSFEQPKQQEPSFWDKAGQKIQEWDKQLGEYNQKQEAKLKQYASDQLQKRYEWEKAHPFISGIQKDYQPGYRGQEIEWEYQKKYGSGLNDGTVGERIGRRLTKDIKKSVANAVAPINIATDIATGGTGTAAKLGTKQVGKQIIKNAIKQTAKTGAIGGGVQGLTSAAGDILVGDATATDLITRPLLYSGAGALLGVPVGAASGKLATTIGKTGQRVKAIEARKATPLANRIKANEANKQVTESVKQQLATPPIVEQKVSAKIAEPEQVLDNLNPTGGVFVDYDPKFRAKAPLAKNMTTYDKTANLNPDDIIEVYRSVPEGINDINAGDFITTNKQLAKDYGGKNIVSKKVKASEIIDDLNEPLGEEYIYRPQKTQPVDDIIPQQSIQETVEQVSSEQIKNLGYTGKEKVSQTYETAKTKLGEEVTKDLAKTYKEQSFEAVDNALKNLPNQQKQHILTNNASDLLDEGYDEAMIARAKMLQFNDDLANTGKLDTYQVDNFNREKTKAGKLLSFSRYLNLDDPVGVAVTFRKMVTDAAPSDAKKLLNNVDKIAKASNRKAITRLLADAKISTLKRKGIMDEIVKLQKEGNLTRETLTDLINKRYKLPELNEADFAKADELLNKINNPNIDEYSKKVNQQLLRKILTDKIPSSLMSKVKAARNLSLLLNFKTLGRNIIGNTLFNTIDTGAKTLAAPIDLAISKFSGARTRVLPQVKESLKGALQGTVKGAKEVTQGIDTRGLGQRFDLNPQNAFRINAPFTPIKNIKDLGKNAGAVAERAMGAFEKLLDYGLRLPDRTFFEGAFAESVANQMKARGFSEITEDILEQAEKEALEAVFQNEGLISQGTLQARRALNKIGTKDFGLGDLLIPYAQTPANLVQQGINYSPLGVVKGIYNLTKGDQRQASLDLARALIGSGAIGAGYGLAKSDVITPSQYADNYIKNKRIKENYELLGERPDSIGGIWYSPFQPMSIPLAAGSAMAYGESPLQAGVNTLVDLPMLQNMNRALSDIQNKGLAEAGINFASSVPSQFTPTILKQIAEYNDPYVRETYDPDKLKQGLNMAQAKIPVLRERLPIRYNVKGKPKINYQTEDLKRAYDVFLNPTFVNKPIDDPTAQEIRRLYETTGETSALLPVAEKKLYGRKESLTGEQLSRYQRLLGDNMYFNLDNFINSEDYQYMTDEERVKEISKIQKAVKKEVKTML